MRILFAVIMASMLAACTSMLLGNASTNESGISSDHRTASQAAADNAMSAAIRKRFSADSLIKQYAIGISTIDSNVTLSGTVGNYEARDRAIQIATDTDGVRNVTNRIIVNTNL